MIREPDFGAKERELYSEALDILDRVGVRYMLGGAIALNAHTGIWRNTKDLDLFVPEESVAQILEALEEVGFETEIEDPLWLAKAWRGDLFVDVIHATHNGTGPVDQSWLENAKEIRAIDRQVLAIPAEEMLLSKIFVVAKDRCDVDDVLHIIFATRGELDWDRILAKVGEHWELLLAHLHIYRYVYPSHTHYLPRRVFKALVGRYQKEDGISEEGPERPLRFRGTMLDEVSFGLDVEEWGLPDERAGMREARSSGSGGERG
jgi:hypothetical protein